MGEKQWLLLQLGKVSEKGGRQDRKKAVLPIGRAGKCMVCVKHTKTHVFYAPIVTVSKKTFSLLNFHFLCTCIFASQVKKLKLKEKETEISFTQHFLPKEIE